VRRRFDSVVHPWSTTLQFILVYTLSDYQRESHVGALDRLLTAGKLQHALGEHFPLDRIVEAHERVKPVVSAT